MRFLYDTLRTGVSTFLFQAYVFMATFLGWIFCNAIMSCEGLDGITQDPGLQSLMQALFPFLYRSLGRWVHVRMVNEAALGLCSFLVFAAFGFLYEMCHSVSGTTSHSELVQAARQTKGAYFKVFGLFCSFALGATVLGLGEEVSPMIGIIAPSLYLLPGLTLYAPPLTALFYAAYGSIVTALVAGAAAICTVVSLRGAPTLVLWAVGLFFPEVGTPWKDWTGVMEVGDFDAVLAIICVPLLPLLYTALWKVLEAHICVGRGLFIWTMSLVYSDLREAFKADGMGQA